MRLWGRVEEDHGRRVIVPAYPHDVLELGDLRTGEVVTNTIRYGRNWKRHRWYWRFMQYVAEGKGLDRHSLHALVLYATDRIEAIVEGSSGPVALVQSTSPEAMEDARFREYVEQAIEIVFRLYLPEVRRKDIIAEVNRMVGFELPPL